MAGELGKADDGVDEIVAGVGNVDEAKNHHCFLNNLMRKQTG